jgi:hypothetical protein
MPGPTGECEACNKKRRLSLQTKLKVNEPGDIYEQEADRIANQVLTAPGYSDVSGAPPRIQRFSGHSNGQLDTAPASVDHALASPGAPLSSVLRQDMEQRFGYDFSRVRVHSGAAVEQSVRDVNANAYTVGHDMVFGADQFAPGTHEGRRLIAHELTHVVQQQNIANSAVSVSHMDSEPALQRRAIPPNPSKVSCAYLLNAREAVAAGLGVRNRNKEGVAAHNAIGKDFASQVGDSAVRIEIEGAASASERTEKCGDAAPSTINPVKFNPSSGRSGLGLPDLVYWDAAGDQSFEIAEIKFATWGCRSDAIAQVDKYVEKAKGSPEHPRKVYGYEKIGKRGKKLKRPKRGELTGDFSVGLMPTSRFNPNPVDVNGRRLSVSWCEPGVIVYKAITREEEEEEEEKRKRAVAEAAPPQHQLTIEFARTLNWFQSGLQPQLTDFIRRAPSGSAYVIIAPPFFYDEFVRKPITLEMQKLYGLSLQPRYNPVHGFRNLGWTLVAGYAGVVTVVVAVGVVLAAVPAEVATGATVGAGTEGASITNLAGWRAAKVLASTPGVKEAAAAGVTLAVYGNVKEASAATRKEPEAEVTNVDRIFAVPIGAVKSQGKIMIGREVKYDEKTYSVIGTMMPK